VHQRIRRFVEVQVEKLIINQTHFSNKLAPIHLPLLVWIRPLAHTGSEHKDISAVTALLKQ
jgi:hypothetical protein